MTKKQVLIGATFACDDELEQPLQVLLTEAVADVQVAVQWLPYGSALTLKSCLIEYLDDSDTNEIDLVVLLVRMSDLDGAHPELTLQHNAQDDASNRSSALTDQLVQDLTQFDALDASPPIVIIICPSPPDRMTEFDKKEQAFASQLQELNKVWVYPSTRIMELFVDCYDTECVYYDPITDRRKHTPYTQPMLNVVSLASCRQICRLYRIAKKKVIVLDCDNTLWSGAVAEVGVDGIQFTPGHLALQRFVLEQQQQGMLLCLCSKNILQDVTDVFNHRKNDLILRLDEHIVLPKVNWQDKSANIEAIAKDLSLGLDSFIFIDDNPVECSEVASRLPMVTVINVPQELSCSFMHSQWVFDTTIKKRVANKATMEDSERTKLYQQNLRRNQLIEKTGTHTAFLSSLGIKITFEELTDATVVDTRRDSFLRVLQLHQRTNQFNIATSLSKQLTEDMLQRFIKSEGNVVICAHVTDRFGHYGLVSTALCRPSGDCQALHVDSFLLSCRALNRGVEHAMIRKIGEIATSMQATKIEFCWEPTERNEPARLLFSSLSDFKFRSSCSQVDQGNDCLYDDRDTKMRQSARSRGVWIVNTTNAIKLSFLKNIDKPFQTSATLWFFRVLKPLSRFARLLVSWILRFIPRWLLVLTRWCRASNHIIGRYSSESGLLCYEIFSHRGLDDFIRSRLGDINAKNVADSFDAGKHDVNTNQEDGKFRRKARHQAKLALINHLHDEIPNIIWSANRTYEEEAADDAEYGNKNQHVTRLRSHCQTRQCASRIQSNSHCAFQRCRNCCYRIQRLLTRATQHQHEAARQSAEQMLQNDFQVDSIDILMQYDENNNWCDTHQNARRRR